jgi:hypothetical protein
VDRIVYDVVRNGTGWRVRTCGYACDCSNQIEAVLCALTLAKGLWESLHAPSAVRVQKADGQWHHARNFGEEALPG